MKRTVLPLLAVLAFCGVAPSQIFTYDWDTSCSVGTSLCGNWTEFQGDWMVANDGNTNYAHAAPVFQWQYATDPTQTFQDCVVQCLAMYNTASAHALQFSGVTLRCNNPGTGSLGSDLVMAKIQGSSTYNSIWLYELNAAGASSATSATGPGSSGGTVRLLAIDQRVEAHIDFTGDGLWDNIVQRTVTLPAKSGPVGLDGFGGGRCDDFALFDGVIMSDPTSPAPREGNKVDMVLRGFPNASYQAASSLGNSGIPVGLAGKVPLVLDGLFRLSALGLEGGSIFVNYGGQRLDGGGNGNISIKIPTMSGALVGTTIYTSFITFGSTGVINIGNDHQTTITT